MSIQNIIQGIPQTKDEIKKVSYLFDQKTLLKGQALKDTELPIIDTALRQYYKPSQIRSWIAQVKKMKKPTSSGQALTHIDIAKEYLKGHVDDVLFARSDYHKYEDGRWQIWPEIAFMGDLGELLEKLEQQDGYAFTHGQQRSIAEMVKQRVAIDDDLLDANPTLINMKNGTFCIEQQKLLPHDSLDYITTQLPFDYDEYANCPTWIWYLRTSLVEPGPDVFGKWNHDEKLIDFMQEAIGYSLTADMTHHKMFWCLGEGSNGKGVLFHILQALGGNAATAFNLDMLNQNYNTYHLAELAGKRLIYCTEVKRDFDFSGDAMLKAVTGGDNIQVRRIREQPFVLKSIGKMWISLNDFPHVKDTSHGFWRRVSIVPFNRVFDENEADPELKDKLIDELPGIFNWAMVGLRRLYQNGNFTQSRQVTEFTAKYKLESNTVAMFVEDECTVDDQDDQCYTTIMPLYAAYKTWSNDNGYKPFSRKNFKREIERLGFKEERKNSARAIVGIKENAKSGHPPVF